jgi:hypothetical protein
MTTGDSHTQIICRADHLLRRSVTSPNEGPQVTHKKQETAQTSISGKRPWWIGSRKINTKWQRWQVKTVLELPLRRALCKSHIPHLIEARREEKWNHSPGKWWTGYLNITHLGFYTNDSHLWSQLSSWKWGGSQFKANPGQKVNEISSQQISWAWWAYTLVIPAAWET